MEVKKMSFDWEQNAFLGYMVEQYEKDRGNDIFGRPLNDNSFWDTDDNDYTTKKEENNYWPF